jgi:hypothetical protein
MSSKIDIFWKNTLGERFVATTGSGSVPTSVKNIAQMTVDEGYKIDRLGDAELPLIRRQFELPFLPLVCQTGQTHIADFPVSVSLSLSENLGGDAEAIEFAGMSLRLIGGSLAAGLRANTPEEWWPVVREVNIDRAESAAIAGSFVLNHFTYALTSQFTEWSKQGDLWVPPTPVSDEQAAGFAV